MSYLNVPSLYAEKYAWVDIRLEQLYYNYALNGESCDEFLEAGLLGENWAWVDNGLEKICSFVDKPPLCLAPLSWVDYRERTETNCLLIETACGKRKRSESDISDYEDEITRAVERQSWKSESKYTFEPITTNNSFTVDVEDEEAKEEDQELILLNQFAELRVMDKDFQKIMAEEAWTDDYDYEYDYDDECESIRDRFDSIDSEESERSYGIYYDSD